MRYQQILFTGVGKAELLEKDLDAPGYGCVLLKMEYTAVSSGTERDNLLGKPNTYRGGFPRTLGYSGVGRVEAVGEGVKGFAVNDRAIVIWSFHASRCVVKEEQLVKIDDDTIPSAEAAFVFIASFPLAGLRKTRLEIGEPVLIQGLGILGIFAVQLARLSGGLPVIASDLQLNRRELALRLGADFAFDPAAGDYTALVKKASSGGIKAVGGVKAAIEVSGNSLALKQVLECCAPMARVALLGCTRVSDTAIDFYQLVHKPGISLIGAHTNARPEKESYPHHWSHRDDCAALLRMLSAKRLDIKSIVSEIHRPEEAPELYRRLAEDTRFPPGVAFDWTAVNM